MLTALIGVNGVVRVVAEKADAAVPVVVTGVLITDADLVIKVVGTVVLSGRYSNVLPP